MSGKKPKSRKVRVWVRTKEYDHGHQVVETHTFDLILPRSRRQRQSQINTLLDIFDSSDKVLRVDVTDVNAKLNFPNKERYREEENR